MSEFLSILFDPQQVLSVVAKTLFVIFLILILNTILNVVRKGLLLKAKTKKQISNVEIFTQIFRYFFTLLIIIFAVLSYSSAWSSFGIFLGFLSAAMGFALQKPITGIAAWMMVVTKRPFDIGDRIIIGDVKGDVLDVTLTHIHVAEIGGLIDGEEKSGRIVMVPNWLLFERNIVNYTSNDDFVMNKVVVNVTYESNLDHAIEIVDLSARKYLAGIIGMSPGGPEIRLDFQASGIDVQVKYFSPARHLHEYSTNITKEIFDRVRVSGDVEIAYPHTEVVFRKKGE
ncbi:mechanosensitive ion channel domain-containing protein [Methanolobus sp. ZRKC3]|uniref:mechanosensitive ion channel family protein n=1 Tax=Methanolobus sp. ZRKC3 TaxID=3125786 RepID=UPI003244C021